MYRMVLLALVCAPSVVPATSDWLYSRSDHFELYTDTDQRLAKSTLETFEQLRDFFLSSRKLAIERVPATVIVFRRNADYRECAPPLTAAFYAPGKSRDFIVMSSAVAGNAEVAAHELTHLLWQRSAGGRDLPLWLSEGMAEVYSTVRPVLSRVRIGATPERSRDALSGRWLPLRYLLTTEALATDPATRHPDAGALYYAQSWLFTHMLMFHPDYRPQFDRVVSEISQGGDSATVITGVYGKPLAVIEKDLYAYGAAPTRKKFAEFDTPLRSLPVEDAVPTEGSAVDVVLALLNARGRPKQTEKTLLAKAEQNEGSLTYWAGLCEFYWLSGDLNSAGACARKAIGFAKTSPNTLWLFARLSRARGEPTLRTVELLNGLLAQDPQHIDGRLMLAHLLIESGEAGRAMHVLDAISGVAASVRGRYHAIKACAHALLSEPGKAEAEIAEAQQHPRTPSDEEMLTRARETLQPTR